MNEGAPPVSGAHLSPSPVLARLLTPQRLIMAVFFLHAVGLSSLWPRMPDLQARLGAGPGELSPAMPRAAGGDGARRALCREPRLAVRAAEHHGDRPAADDALIALPGWSFDVVSLFVALFVIGLSYPVVDIAMNVEADRIERMGGRRIMSTCHGCWTSAP